MCGAIYAIKNLKGNVSYNLIIPYNALHYIWTAIFTLARQKITTILLHNNNKKKAISLSKFISIFIVFRNPRIKSFLVFFPLPFTIGKNERQAKRHAFPSRRDALQDGRK